MNQKWVGVWMAAGAWLAGNVACGQSLQNVPGPGAAYSSPAVAMVADDQTAQGLKEALEDGARHAIAQLGRPGGFLQDAAVRIPLPSTLQKADKTLRSLGEGKLVDDFVTAMNHAAEQAVPEAAGALAEAVHEMTWREAARILSGPPNAATEYFQRTSETNLQARLLPLVQQAMNKTGVTKIYNEMMDKVDLGGLAAAGGVWGSLGKMASKALGSDTMDVDGYVTRKTLDALYAKIAEQEKAIRQNPAARTSELLQTVFGAVAR
ncbi:MAG TPA: DUF4197 domain-containing protein [Verrucomicrobiae bacterium]|jgi:hypothetical protein|nr:DUF4197 domain-containing protein [Verrucomicrobiae bacterium]